MRPAAAAVAPLSEQRRSGGGCSRTSMQQLLAELADLCFVNQSHCQVSPSGDTVTVRGLDSNLVDNVLLPLNDVPGQEGLLGQATFSARAIQREAQDGLWTPSERHPNPGRKSVLVHTMTLPTAAVEPLVSALKRDADTNHPQVLTDMGFEVDFKLKGIITCLNRHGFTTTNSCQDNHAHIWIEFSAPEVYADLFELAYRHDKAWCCRFLASDDRCQTTMVWVVDAHAHEDRKAEPSEHTQARPHRVTNGHPTIRIPTRYFQEFALGIFRMCEAHIAQPARASLAQLTPFVEPTTAS